MRTAGIVMTILGLISLVISIYGVFIADKGMGAGYGDLIFFNNSWFPIMFLFWFGAGISLLLTFPSAAEEEKQRRQQKY